MILIQVQIHAVPYYLRAEGASRNTISRSASVSRPRCHPISRLAASGFCRESIMLTRRICKACYSSFRK